MAGEIQRYSDWDLRLQNFLEACTHAPFAWGAFDCCTFAIDAIEAMTGTRVLRVLWDTQAGAVRVLRELGAAGAGELALGSALARVAFDAGLDEIPREKAGRGDLVLVDSGDPRWTRAAAIVQGTHALAPGRPGGLALAERARWIRAWHVPFAEER